MREYSTGVEIAPLLESVMNDFPGMPLKFDRELALYREFLGKYRTGEKRTTARFGGDRIRLPAHPVLPLFETRPDDHEYKQHVGRITIPRLRVKTIGELTDEDGVKDGFSGREELARVIRDIYEPIYQRPIADGEFVSVYALGPLTPP